MAPGECEVCVRTSLGSFWRQAWNLAKLTTQTEMWTAPPAFFASLALAVPGVRPSRHDPQCGGGTRSVSSIIFAAIRRAGEHRAGTH